MYLGELRRSRELPHDGQEGLRADTCGMVVWNEERQESRPVFLRCSRDVVLGVRLDNNDD
jgi:hypothetical protein